MRLEHTTRQWKTTQCSRIWLFVSRKHWCFAFAVKIAELEPLSPKSRDMHRLGHQNHRTCTDLVTKITRFKPHYTLQITKPTTRADLKQALQEEGHNTPQAHNHLKKTSSIEFVFLDFTHCLAICYCQLYHNNIAGKEYCLNNINLILI